MTKEIEILDFKSDFLTIIQEISKTHIPMVIKSNDKPLAVLLSYKGFKTIEAVFERLDNNKITKLMQYKNLRTKIYYNPNE